MFKKRKLKRKNIVITKPQGIVATLFSRKISIHISRFCGTYGITPNQLTILGFILSLVAAYLYATGNYTAFLIGAFLIQLSFILDCCDGEVAYLTGKGSQLGAFLDKIFDRFSEIALFAGVALGAIKQTGNPNAWLYAFLGFASLFTTHLLFVYCNEGSFKKPMKKIHSGLIGKLAKKLRMKPEFFVLSVDVHMLIFSIGGLINSMMFILWFFIIVQTLYMLLVLYLRIKNDAPQKKSSLTTKGE